MSSLCTVCGGLTQRGPRCSRHPKWSGPGNPVHTDPRWTALSRRMVAHHVGHFGWVCPGDGPQHIAHPSRDLTCDHVIPLEDGGAPFDPANTRILCRSWNSSLGARLLAAKRAGQRLAQIVAPLDERAQIRARYLG